MRRFTTALMSSLMLLGIQVVSAQPESRAAIAKQQLSECMARRMSANKNLSYNEAMRVCKERLQPPKDLAANNPADAGAKSH